MAIAPTSTSPPRSDPAAAQRPGPKHVTSWWLNEALPAWTPWTAGWRSVSSLTSLNSSALHTACAGTTPLFVPPSAILGARDWSKGRSIGSSCSSGRCMGARGFRCCVGACSLPRPSYRDDYQPLSAKSGESPALGLRSVVAFLDHPRGPRSESLRRSNPSQAHASS